jgi:hypothetical protein
MTKERSCSCSYELEPHRDVNRATVLSCRVQMLLRKNKQSILSQTLGGMFSGTFSVEIPNRGRGSWWCVCQVLELLLPYFDIHTLDRVFDLSLESLLLSINNK